MTVSAEARRRMSAAARKRHTRARAEKGLCTWERRNAVTNVLSRCGARAAPGGLLCTKHQEELDAAETEPLTVACSCGWSRPATRGSAGDLFRAHRATGCTSS